MLSVKLVRISKVSKVVWSIGNVFTKWDAHNYSEYICVISGIFCRDSLIGRSCNARICWVLSRLNVYTTLPWLHLQVCWRVCCVSGYSI